MIKIYSLIFNHETVFAYNFSPLTFCGPSEQEIKAYIDSSIEEAVQAEQEIKAYIDSSIEEAVNEIQKTSIENQNFQNENVKSDF